MLLVAQRKSLFERIDSLSRAHPLGRQEFAGGEEVQAIVVLRHVQQVVEQLQEGLDYIEFMLCVTPPPSVPSFQFVSES